jgi:hypothetical protein
MGATSKSLALFLCLFSLITLSSCASLPRTEDYVPLRADVTPKIIGPRGQLSPKISNAIMERLKGQCEPTDILFSAGLFNATVRICLTIGYEQSSIQGC